MTASRGKHSSKGRRRRPWARDRGAAAVEFAIIAPILIAALTGIVDYGLAMYNKMELMGAVRAGAQVALIDYTDTTAIKQAVVDSTNAGITTADVTTTQFCECADGSTITCGNTCADSSSNRYFMTISATQNYTLMLLGTTIAIDASTTIRTR